MHIAIEGASHNQVQLLAEDLNRQIQGSQLVTFPTHSPHARELWHFNNYLETDLKRFDLVVDAAVSQHPIVIQAHTPLYPTVTWLKTMEARMSHGVRLIRRLGRQFNRPGLLVLLTNYHQLDCLSPVDDSEQLFEQVLHYLAEEANYYLQAQVGLRFGHRPRCDIVADVVRLVESLQAF